MNTTLSAGATNGQVGAPRQLCILNKANHVVRWTPCSSGKLHAHRAMHTAASVYYDIAGTALCAPSRQEAASSSSSSSSSSSASCSPHSIAWLYTLPHRGGGTSTVREVRAVSAHYRSFAVECTPAPSRNAWQPACPPAVQAPSAGAPACREHIARKQGAPGGARACALYLQL